MSEREMRAVLYSEKCARRNQRKRRRRNARISKLIGYGLPFSIGCLVMAGFVAVLV